jgi:hypothetical protein
MICPVCQKDAICIPTHHPQGEDIYSCSKGKSHYFKYIDENMWSLYIFIYDDIFNKEIGAYNGKFYLDVSDDLSYFDLTPLKPEEAISVIKRYLKIMAFL